MSSNISLGQTDAGLFFPIRITENDHNLLTASSIAEPNGQVLLGTPECITIIADSLPALPLVDPQNRKGWYYINSDNTAPVGRNKMNWYFYSGANKGYRIGDLRLITTIASLSNPLKKFFYVVYTKNGTSRTYETPELLLEGEKCLFFFGESGYIPQNEGNLRNVRLVATHDNGLVLDSMEILYISIHSNSSDALNSYAVCIERFGYRLDNLTMDIILATPESGGGSSSDVNILSSVSLDVVNQSLTNMSFYDDGVKGKYLNVNTPNNVSVVNEALSNMYFTNSTFGNKLLNVFLPELTNIHIIGQENDLTVEVVNTNPIEVVNIQTLNTLLITETSFNNLNDGGFSGSITLENSSIQSFFGNASLDGTISTGGQIIIQFSIDNTNWYNTYNIFYISSVDITKPTPISAQYTFAIKYIRIIIGGQTMKTININVCYK
jgi:hypothetical protein